MLSTPEKKTKTKQNNQTEKRKPGLNFRWLKTCENWKLEVYAQNVTPETGRNLEREEVEANISMLLWLRGALPAPGLPPDLTTHRGLQGTSSESIACYQMGAGTMARRHSFPFQSQCARLQGGVSIRVRCAQMHFQPEKGNARFITAITQFPGCSGVHVDFSLLLPLAFPGSTAHAP